MTTLKTLVAALDKVRTLQGRTIAALAKRMGASDVRVGETVKDKIKEHFEKHHGENIDYAELAVKLTVPLHIAVQACDELEKEGEIKKGEKNDC